MDTFIENTTSSTKENKFDITTFPKVNKSNDLSSKLGRYIMWAGVVAQC